MGFLDDLNEYTKKKQSSAHSNTDSQTAGEKTTSTNVVDAVNVSPTDNLRVNNVINMGVDNNAVNRANVQNSPTSVNKPNIYKNKPESLSNDDWNRLLRHFPEDKILQHYDKPFEPNGSDGLFTRIFKENIKQPDELDEKKIRNAKVLGSVADAASMIIQMLSANGDGAYIRNRDYNLSASAGINKDERDLRRLYAAKRDKYKADLFNVQMKDVLQGYNEHNAMQKNINSILMQGDKADMDMEKFNLQMLFKQGNEDWDRQFKEMQEKNREKDRNARLNIQRSNLDENRKRTDAYIKRTGSGSNAGYEMRIDASKNDTDAVKDEFNNSVRVIQLSKGQIDQYAQKALSNPAFIGKHPELVTTDLVTGKTSYAPKDRLARTYIQDWYDNNKADDMLSDLWGKLSGYGKDALNKLGEFGRAMGKTDNLNSDEYDSDEYLYDNE